MMIVYKITNIINNKIYIGQTTNTLEERLHGHILEATKYNRLNNKLVKAIKEFGYENFKIEPIEFVDNKDDLNKREIYWINYYNSIENGYNTAAGGKGGNTYKGKTKEEMKNIKEKLRKTKIGKLNPNSKPIKCKNVDTNEELFFDSLNDAVLFFKEKNNGFISARCNHKVKFLYKDQWLFSFKNDEYINDYFIGKDNLNSKKCKVINLINGETKNFSSYSAIKKYYNLSNKDFYKNFNGKNFIVNDCYKIIVLN